MGATGPSMPNEDTCPRIAHPFKQLIAVTNDGPSGAYPPRLGFPMAFPKGADLRSMKGFHVSALGGDILPSQIQVLSRWGADPDDCAAPIRFAYVHALADVQPGPRRFLRLAHQPGIDPQAPIHLRMENTNDQIVIDTGPARFTIRKDWFNGLSRVELKGAEGFSPILDIPSEARAGLMVQIDGQPASPIYGRIDEIQVERKGPVLVTIAVRGKYGLRNRRPKLSFKVRMHFSAGTAAVRIDHSYRQSKKRETVERAWLRLPIQLGSGAQLLARLKGSERTISSSVAVALAQTQTAPGAEPRATLLIDNKLGAEQRRGEAPFLALLDDRAYVLATLAHMEHRGPMGLRYRPASADQPPSFEVEFQSAPFVLNTARGHSATAVLDFGHRAGLSLPDRASQLYTGSSRPLVGLPKASYLNSTGALGRLPQGSGPARQAFEALAQRLHDGSVEYLDRHKIHGAPRWPDLPKAACPKPAGCSPFPSGAGNAFDWAAIELERFIATGDPKLLHDLAYPEALLLAESLRDDENTAPSRALALAYFLTDDGRFRDRLKARAERSIEQLKPSARPKKGQERSASQSTINRFFPLLDAARFADRKGRYLTAAKRSFEYMLPRSLLDGHGCDQSGRRNDDARRSRRCLSTHAAQMGPLAAWVQAIKRDTGSEKASAWLASAQGMRGYSTATSSTSPPDIHARYSCKAGRKGIVAGSCQPQKAQLSESERAAALAARAVLWDGQTPEAAACAWLPGQLKAAIEALAAQPNVQIWSEDAARALQHAQRAIAQLERCP